VGEGIGKRQHLRLSAMGQVEVVIQGRQSGEGYLASIGRGGLGLYFREEVVPAQLVLVNLRLLAMAGSGDPEELKVAVRVRWARAAGELWMAGVAFEQMSDVRYERLLRHMNLIEAWQLGRRAVEQHASRNRFSVRE